MSLRAGIGKIRHRPGQIGMSPLILKSVIVVKEATTLFAWRKCVGEQKQTT